jgi:hypothetical protein
VTLAASLNEMDMLYDLFVTAPSSELVSKTTKRVLKGRQIKDELQTKIALSQYDLVKQTSRDLQQTRTDLTSLRAKFERSETKLGRSQREAARLSSSLQAAADEIAQLKAANSGLAAKSAARAKVRAESQMLRNELASMKLALAKMPEVIASLVESRHVIESWDKTVAPPAQHPNIPLPQVLDSIGSINPDQTDKAWLLLQAIEADRKQAMRTIVREKMRAQTMTLERGLLLVRQWFEIPELEQQLHVPRHTDLSLGAPVAALEVDPKIKLKLLEEEEERVKEEQANLAAAFVHTIQELTGPVTSLKKRGAARLLYRNINIQSQHKQRRAFYQWRRTAVRVGTAMRETATAAAHVIEVKAAVDAEHLHNDQLFGRRVVRELQPAVDKAVAEAKRMWTNGANLRRGGVVLVPAEALKPPEKEYHKYRI